jgi:L-methionine (R)-S-oxide reductase
VQDVHQVPGHIACDASTDSEIVVPLTLRIPAGSLLQHAFPDQPDICLGVLDIDCQSANVWSEEDEYGLQSVIDWLMDPAGVVDWTSALQR